MRFGSAYMSKKRRSAVGELLRLVTAMAIAVPPIATMMMVPEAQCAVYSSNAGADCAANDSSYGTRSSITSMGAFLRTAY
jgi:hypothetical protein